MTIVPFRSAVVSPRRERLILIGCDLHQLNDSKADDKLGETHHQGQCISEDGLFGFVTIEFRGHS